MGRIGTFIFGLAIGAGLIFGAQRYHLLRTAEGFYLVPKIESTMSDAYVDIRQFRLDDWARRPSLAAAILKAKKEHLLGDAAGSSFRDNVESAMQSLTSDRG